jgi:hypothetical protein
MEQLKDEELYEIEGGDWYDWGEGTFSCLLMYLPF